MRFHAPTGQMTIDTDALRRAVDGFRYAMRCIRKMEGLTMDRYKREGALTNADHAQMEIIDAAAALGIDMGAQWGNEIDLRDSDEVNG